MIVAFLLLAILAVGGAALLLVGISVVSWTYIFRKMFAIRAARKLVDERGARHRDDRNILFDAGTHQMETGIRKSGCSGIGDDRHVFPVPQQRQEFECPLMLVVVVVAHGPDMNVVMREQQAGVAGVFGGYEIDRLQHLDRAKRDVCEISDRG